MRMPAWYDIYGLTPDAEEDEEGIDESAMIVHSMIDAVSFAKSSSLLLFNPVNVDNFMPSCLVHDILSIQEQLLP